MVKFVKPKKRVYRKRVPKRSGKPSKSFVKKVQSIVRRNVESKQAYRQEFNTTFNGAITTATDALQLIPNIIAGTADSSRIGDQITAQSLTIKGHIHSNLTFTGITQCRLGVRMMIVTPKQYNNFANVQANAALWLQLLLKKGSTVTAFTGIVPDLYAKINTDAITCHYDKVMYITTPYLQTAVGDTTIYGSTKFFSKTFRFKNKILKYDNGIDLGLTPSNYSPVLIVGYVKLDGTAPDANTQCAISYDAYLNYEDA